MIIKCVYTARFFSDIRALDVVHRQVLTVQVLTVHIATAHSRMSAMWVLFSLYTKTHTTHLHNKILFSWDVKFCSDLWIWMSSLPPWTSAKSNSLLYFTYLLTHLKDEGCMKTKTQFVPPWWGSQLLQQHTLLRHVGNLGSLSILILSIRSTNVCFIVQKKTTKDNKC